MRRNACLVETIMLLTTPLRNFELPAADDGQASTWDEPLADLRSYFGVEFSLWDIPGERLLRRGVGQIGRASCRERV